MVSGLSRMCSCKNGKYFLSAWWLMLRCHWARPHPPAEVAQHYLHASFNLNRCLHACMRDYRQLELIKLTNIQWLACIVCIAQYSITSTHSSGYWHTGSRGFCFALLCESQFTSTRCYLIFGQTGSRSTVTQQDKFGFQLANSVGRNAWQK